MRISDWSSDVCSSDLGLLGIRMDTAIEVAVTGENCSGVQVALDDFLLDHRVQRTGHAVTGGAGVGDDAETEFFQLAEQPSFFQVQLGDLGTRREGRLHPGLAHQDRKSTRLNSSPQ